MADSYTIRIYIPNGDPEGLRIISRMDWTGSGVVFPREDWPNIKQRPEFGYAGVYILIGHAADDDLPTLYIGQGDVVRARLESHVANKDFWSSAVTFVSTGGLNSAHAKWLEYALVKRALEMKRCHLENSTEPQAPQLSELDRDEMQKFMREILQILPLIGLNCFEKPKVIAAPMAKSASIIATASGDGPDTVIVPAHKDSFQKMFIGENAWWAIPMPGGVTQKIKYVAAYQTKPVQAITYLAPVAQIEPYGDKGKYKLIFSEPAKPINAIPLGKAHPTNVIGPRYTLLTKLLAAKTLSDLLHWESMLK